LTVYYAIVLGIKTIWHKSKANKY